MTWAVQILNQLSYIDRLSIVINLPIKMLPIALVTILL